MIKINDVKDFSLNPGNTVRQNDFPCWACWIDSELI